MNQESKYVSDLIEVTSEPFLILNTEGKITNANEAFVKFTGIGREQLFNTNFCDYFADIKKAQTAFIQIFEKGFISNYPLTIIHKNGNLTDVLYTASIYKGDDGAVLGAFATAKDKTIQKKTESELEKSLREISAYKMALEESSIVAITDKNGIINYVNDNFCKISKYKREELIGKDHRIVNSGYHSKDFMKDLWATISNGKNWRGEIKNKAKDKSTYWVDTTIIPFLNEEGTIYQYVAIRSDITAKKSLSQYTLSLIEASRDPLVTISPEGKITDMNEATVNITGVSREKLIGSNFKNYFTDPKKASEVYQQVFEKGFVSDYPLTIKDHKLTDVLFNGSVYKDDRGIVVGAVIVARDITEQRKHEKELIEAKVYAEIAMEASEQAKKKAENAVKVKQQFLSNMSHEIRTPMNAIIGFTKVILKTNLTEKQKEYLTAIKTSGDTLIVLINDILDLAKIEAGKMNFEFIPFKIASSLSTMLHLFEPKIEEKNLKLIKIYDEKIPEVLVGDSVRLNQIILNLVSNAVKFTTKGEITVSVKLLSETTESVKLEFAVIDSGIGIAANKMDHIFDSFQQAASETSRLYGGTGLGLSIVKQLVEAKGGSLTVKSELDKGSNFTFILDFKKTNAVEEIDNNILELDPDVKNIKVLVVEDIALNQLLMKTLLDDFGFDHDIASNGQIAIEKLKNKIYDIILMDLQMPIMNGFEATEYIRNTMNSKIPIIALTADVTPVDIAKCDVAGMNDYVAKPVDERILYSKIIGLVKKPSLNNFTTTAINSQNEKQKCINLNYLIQRTKYNKTLMMEMISIYLEQTPVLINKMKLSLQEKDWSSLSATVHKIIPSFSIMGIDSDFEKMAKKIQEFSNQQLLSNEIHELVLKLEHICNQACSELEEEYNLIKNIKNEQRENQDLSCG